MIMQKVTPTTIEKEVKNIDLIVSKSDKDGNITYVNPIFIKISGYSQAELLEKPHSILRHPDMPKVIFKYLWDTLHNDNDVVAYVKNLCKDGSYYWVLATVKIAKNPDGSFRNYMSTRRCITQNAKNNIIKLYSKLLDIEKTDGIEGSQKSFDNFLVQNGINNAQEFNTFMQNLNK
jgi:PAS domain S-box-containing protein